MAIDVCPEISSPGLLSPRISFSHDLNECDVVPIEDRRGRMDASLLDSSALPASDFDFDFAIGATFRHELSSADELFSEGKILPVEIKREEKPAVILNCARHQAPSPPERRQPITSAAIGEKKRLKDFISASFDDDAEDQKPQSSSKPFWQFKRSSSLNCDAAKSKGLIRSLHFLSRSNSTGSVPNRKQDAVTKENQRQNLQRQPSVSGRRRSASSSSSSSTSSSSPFAYNNSSQKPPLKKRYGTGVRVNPVLNFQPHISIGTVSLFGLGSLFCNGKVRKKNK